MNTTSPRYQILGEMRPEYSAILTPEALAFVADLAQTFTPRVRQLLAARHERQKRFDAGEKPGFLKETAAVRSGDWTVAPLPKDLLDRRVEITGPVDRKMVINALNSPASCFMADFEDATSPSWHNMVEGQANLRDAVARTITYEDPHSGKHYSLGDKLAVLLVRPRGWHLPESHLRVDGQDVPGALFDFGLYFFHNAKPLLARGSGPYFYLPKLQSHLEARLWNDVFVHAQKALGIDLGSIKATVLIETLPAAFEMDEILYELREHSSGLNCGRWDYIFSMIKTLRNDPGHVFPDRQQVTMLQHCMRSYTQLLIKTCHRRNVHAMGGMAAQIPIKDDPEGNKIAFEKVRADKLREAQDGHDGTWVAHPGLIPIAKEVFDANMPGANQLDRKRDDVNVSAADLLTLPEGTRTEDGLRANIRVGVQYIEAWLHGHGAVPLYHLMEDAATAEICRTQLWQWLHFHATLDDGQPLSEQRFLKTFDEELAHVRAEIGEQRFNGGYFDQARTLFKQMCLAPELDDFLTLPAYEYLLKNEARHR
jgi:malate synthase